MLQNKTGTNQAPDLHDKTWERGSLRVSSPSFGCSLIDFQLRSWRNKTCKPGGDLSLCFVRAFWGGETDRGLIQISQMEPQTGSSERRAAVCFLGELSILIHAFGSRRKTSVFSFGVRRSTHPRVRPRFSLVFFQFPQQRHMWWYVCVGKKAQSRNKHFTLLEEDWECSSPWSSWHLPKSSKSLSSSVQAC